MLREIGRRLLRRLLMRNRSRYYYRDGTPIHSMLEWAFLMEQDRHVGNTFLPNGIHISTVWLGLDHSFSDDGPPLIFESMAFDAEEKVHEPSEFFTSRFTYHEELDCVRYSTEAEAVVGHMAMCEKFFAGSRTLTWPLSEG